MLAVPATRRLLHLSARSNRSLETLIYSKGRRVNKGCRRSSSSITTARATTGSEGGGLLRLLTDDERRILSEQRDLVSKAGDIARRVEATRSAVGEGVRRGGARGDLTPPWLWSNPTSPQRKVLPDTLLSLVVAGEFNAGKSTLINALLDNPTMLPTGSLPTTEKLTVVCSALPETNDMSDLDPAEAAKVQYVVVPDAPLLTDVTIVDTPGTNTFHRHTEETLRVLPEADWILFCTSADRPMPASEQALLRSVAAFRKTVVIVVNKIDLLHASGGDHGAREQQKVIDYVRHHASRAMSTVDEDDLTVLAVSARYALAAKALQSSSGVGKRSGLPELHEFLTKSLGTTSKVKAKLSSPLGVSMQQMAHCLSVLEDDKEELETDTATLRLLQLHMEAWRSDLDQSMRTSRRDIVQVLEQQANRCHFLLRRVSWIDLLRMSATDRSSLVAEWEKTQVLPRSTLDAQLKSDEHAALKSHLLALVREAADSIALKGRAQGQAVIEFLGKRPSARHSQSLVGSVTSASNFEDSRRSLTLSMTGAVDGVLAAPSSSRATPGEVAETRHVLDRMQSVGRMSVSLGLSGLAAWLATALQLLDIPAGAGAGAGLMAAGGLVLSSAHWRIANDHQHQWLTLSADLEKELERICSKEVTRMERRVDEGVAPYRMCIEAERSRIELLAAECNELTNRVMELRSRIDALG
jgi:small GTP-binding protein